MCWFVPKKRCGNSEKELMLRSGSSSHPGGMLECSAFAFDESLSGDVGLKLDEAFEDWDEPSSSDVSEACVACVVCDAYDRRDCGR